MCSTAFVNVSNSCEWVFIHHHCTLRDIIPAMPNTLSDREVAMMLAMLNLLEHESNPHQVQAAFQRALQQLEYARQENPSYPLPPKF